MRKTVALKTKKRESIVFEILNTASHVKNRKREEEKCFHQKYAMKYVMK